MVRIRSQICIRIRNLSEVGSGSKTLDLNPPGIPAHASEGPAADRSSCRRRRLPASCQKRSPAQHRTRASADQRRTCRKKETNENGVPDQWHFETDPDSEALVSTLDYESGSEYESGSGSWSGSCSFLQWFPWHQSSKIPYQVMKKSQNSWKINVNFLLVTVIKKDLYPRPDTDSDEHKIITDPDPGGSKTTDLTGAGALLLMYRYTAGSHSQSTV